MTSIPENPNVHSDVSASNSKLRTADIAGATKSERPEDLTQVEAVPERATPERTETDQTPLFNEDVTRDFRARWQNIQIGFVDQPRASVEQADELVAQTMQRLAQSFSEQRGELEKQWDASEQISTEDLRLALRRYRSFFERLLAI